MSNTFDHEVLAALVREVRVFVKRLPINDAIRDDIVSNTCLLISERIMSIEQMALDDAKRWVRGATFLVARSTGRAEFRRTVTWRRLREAYEDDQSGSIVRVASRQQQVTVLLTILSALTDLDRQLLIGQIWDGHTCQQLAEKHGLSVNAVKLRLGRARQTCRQEAFRKSTEKLEEF
jgi:DNA-directed RNA polymerase specialized sigma24 family protein